MKLIDKDALVAEIERLRINYGCFSEYDMGFSEGRSSAFDEVLSFLDALEVKEVQEEPTSNGLKTESYLENKYKEILKQLKANGGKLWKG